MKNLRLAAFVTIIGGLVTIARLAQALAIEIAYDGPHDLPHTVPLFLAFFFVSLGVVLCGVLFLKNPSKKHASWVSRACVFSLLALLASLHTGPGFSLLITCVVYFLVLKPAVINAFGADEGPTPLFQPTAPSGRD